MATPSYTAYTPTPGLDPVYDGWLATYTARMANAANDVQFERSKMQDEYNRGVSQLGNQIGGRRNELVASMLGRGVGRSSEALNRRAELDAEYTNQLSDAERARLEGFTTLDQQLAKMYDDLAAERETQIGASRERLLARPDKPTVPGVTTPGAANPSAPSVPEVPGVTTPGTTQKPYKPKKKVVTKKAPAKTTKKAPAKPIDYYGYASQYV